MAHTDWSFVVAVVVVVVFIVTVVIAIINDISVVVVLVGCTHSPEQHWLIACQCATIILWCASLSHRYFGTSCQIGWRLFFFFQYSAIIK